MANPEETTVLTDAYLIVVTAVICPTSSISITVYVVTRIQRLLWCNLSCVRGLYCLSWSISPYARRFDLNFLEPEEANQIIANLGVSSTLQDDDDTTSKIDRSAPDVAPTGKSEKTDLAPIQSMHNPNGESRFYKKAINPSAVDDEHKV